MNNIHYKKLITNGSRNKTQLRSQQAALLYQGVRSKVTAIFFNRAEIDNSFTFSSNLKLCIFEFAFTQNLA